MGAREKINLAHFNGALLGAVCLGWLSGSWTVFWLMLLYLSASSLYAGQIRVHSRRR